MMFYKSSALAIGLILASILDPRGYVNRTLATEIPTIEGNPITPESLEIGTVEVDNHVVTFEPPVLVSSDLSSQIEIDPQPPTTDPSVERSSFTLAPTGNLLELRANTLAMAYVSPLSDVLGVPVVQPSGTKIAQTSATTTPEPEPKKWAVGIHTQASTTGFVGVDAGYKFSPNLHARLGINTVGFGYDYSSQGIDYSAKVSPSNVHLLGDYFPFGGGLRLTGGFVFQNNRFSGSAKSNANNQINVNGTNYNASQIGTIESTGSFSNSVAPYLGIGFGTPINSGFGFNVDLGVMFAGSPTVSLAANNVSPSLPPSVQSQFRSDLAAQERQTNADIKGFNLYPVLSIGVSYAF